LLALFCLSVAKSFSQADSCVVLGCAANYGTQTTNNALTPLFGGFPGSCYQASPLQTYTQIFWQFFFVDPGGPTGNYTQTFTPTNGTTPLDIDWVAYDIGTTRLSSLTCPIDRTGWTEVQCSGAGTFGDPAGPGINGILPTTPGHYYAIGIIINPSGANSAQDTNDIYTVVDLVLGVLPLVAANCALL